MATRKATSPATRAETPDVSPAPPQGNDVKITVKRKRRRLYDPVPESAETAAAEATPAAVARKTAKQARKRPAKARRRTTATAAKTTEPAAKTKTPATEAKKPAARAKKPAAKAEDRVVETPRPGADTDEATAAGAARADAAQELVKKYSLGTAAVGLVPVPLIDLVASSVLQSRMLKALTELYEVEYSEQRARIFTGAMVGSVTSVSVARQTGVVLGSLLKSMPAVGLVAAVTLMPAATGASTYALGTVFIQHFETGGTLLDFDPEKMRAYYQQQVAEAQASPGA